MQSGEDRRFDERIEGVEKIDQEISTVAIRKIIPALITDEIEAREVHDMTKAKRGRPPGTGKPSGEKFVLKSIKVPPEFWEAFAAVVPASERSERIHDYVRREIAKRKRSITSS